MKKIRVLMDVRRGRYYTGRWWDTPWSYDPSEAYDFVNGEEEVDSFIQSVVDDIESDRCDLFDGIDLLEFRIIYWNPSRG